MSWDFFLKVGGSICIFYAIYLNLENMKLKKQVRSNSWLNLHRVMNTVNILDEVLGLYKTIHRSNLNTEVLEPIIRANIHNQEFSKGIIHQIQMFEPTFEEKDFVKWEGEGKLENVSLKVFNAIHITADDKKSSLSKGKSFLKRRIKKKKEVVTVSK